MFSVVQSLVLLFNEKVPKLSDVHFSAPGFLALVSSGSETGSETSIALGKRSYRSLKVLSFTSTSDMPGTSFKTEGIAFISGNSNVEKTEGIIHIFKRKIQKEAGEECQVSTMLCILGIPSHITVKQLLEFCSPMKQTILEIKIVKGNHIGHYLALLNFKTEINANQFYYALNGVAYNTFDRDVCQLAYVSHVEAISSSLGASFPLRNLVELPSCPVCLEKLDEPVQGILTTILCNHNFHDDCISQTTEMTCPVCRYVQSPEMLGDSQCADCDLRENLWICLICGHLGCGRYGRKHAHHHFQETGHTFALELGKNLVWDYADDAYVHRLAVNHEDGKLVQVGEGSETGDKKADDLTTEFSAIMISQLESQRQYFESQLDSVVSESTARASDLESKLNKAMKSITSLEVKVAVLAKEKANLSQKLAQATSLSQKLQSDLSEEKALTSSLSSSQSVWEGRAKKAELIAQQAREEVRDLMLNLELREKLIEVSQENTISSEDIAGGQITISDTSKSRRRRRRR